MDLIRKPKPPKKKKKKAAKPPKDENTPHKNSKFTGKRFEFLNSRLEEYFVAADNQDTAAFFDKHIDEYYKMFHWRLPRDQDPVEGEVWDLTDEDEVGQKGLVLQATTEVCASFYSCFRYSVHHRL